MTEASRASRSVDVYVRIAPFIYSTENFCGFSMSRTMANICKTMQQCNSNLKVVIMGFPGELSSEVLFCIYYKYLRPKKLILCFSGTLLSHSTPTASKIFIAFPVLTLKNCLNIANCQFWSDVICRHFVC